MTGANKGCARMGCKRKAKFFPKLILVPMDDREMKMRATMVMELPICHGHRREVTVDVLLPPEVWASICKAFMSSGKPVPDRNRIGLDWKAIETHSCTGGAQIVNDYSDKEEPEDVSH